MMNIKPIFLLCIGMSFLCCDRKASKTVSPNVNANEALWLDKTDTYLPITGEWTNRVEVADINGDDMVDLLFANGGNYSEPGALEYSRIFINQGAENQFQEVTKQIFTETKYLSRVIKVRDINNDTIADIIIGTTYQSQSQLYLGMGNGKFQNVTSSQLPQIKASVGDLELGDVDNDGDLDIILSDWGAGSNMNNSGGRTMLWLNDGYGNFTDVTEIQMPELLIQFSWDLEFFDFDNDFDLDIAISCKRCATSRIFVNNGKGSFEDKRLLPAYTNNYDLEIMDVNGDGFLDLITVNDGEIVQAETDSRREHLFINNGGKNFIDGTQEYWPDSENIGKDDNNIAFLDYDSDGDPDFIISSLTGEDRLLVNDGKGKFKLSQPVLSGKPTPLTLWIALGDINKDKKLDIIMGQGEGEEGIEERIFVGHNIKPDTASPIISHYEVTKNEETETTTVKARIHDNKSPNMPQDWDSIHLMLGENSNPVPMTWYGENLWYVTISNAAIVGTMQIYATDYCGNNTILTIR